MLRTLMLAGLALFAAPALAQSSNSSSNSSSNNGYGRERIVDSYCDRGWCERTVVRRNYSDDRRQARRAWRERRDWDRPRYRNWRRDD